jgi:hypothetical protein
MCQRIINICITFVVLVFQPDDEIILDHSVHFI